MSAATTIRARDKILSPYRPIGAFVASGTTFLKGWHLMRNASGLLVLPTEVPGLLPGGFADRSLLAAPTGNDTDEANAETGLYSVRLLASDLFTLSDAPRPIYAVNNDEFGRSAISAAGATRSIAGLFLSLNTDPLPPGTTGTYALAWIGPEGVAMAAALAAAQSTGTTGKARGVLTNLGGTTTYAAGVLTGPANTAIGTQDGISTVAVGDVFWAPKGLTNLPAAAQAGPWQFVALGSGSSSWSAVRPVWYLTGSTIPIDYEVRVGAEGTGPLAGTTWRAFCAPGTVVDTGDPLFWPQRVSVSTTLGTGGVSPAITSIPIRSSLSSFTFTPTTLATDGTVTLWRPTSVAAGVLGTASFTVTGESAAGTAVTGARTVGTAEWTNW